MRCGKNLLVRNLLLLYYILVSHLFNAKIRLVLDANFITLLTKTKKLLWD